MPDRPLCVQCRRRSVEPDYRPFCSERCKMADLGRWLSGDYRVAGPVVGDPDSEAGPADEDVDPERD
jgi:endogenous inhibitor of DNA gyrase (YacG/DUF329 family)